jgi:UDP-glucose 4-epimerase
VNIPAAQNEVFNIGADKPYTVNELATVVCKEFGVEPDIKHLTARNEVLHAYSDHTKAHKVFGEPTGITLQEGIARMAAWAKKTGARQGQEFGNIEISEKLPDGWNLAKKEAVH